ncbi:hypothetical protein ACUNIY_12715 [Serratia sp. IR-2025]|uniref:hypothetical protein n=1 Tax=Serratia marcescens TaxID=615 RepID=UPI0038796D30
MNKKILRSAMALSALLAGQAGAAGTGASAELKVSGELAPASCVVQVADSKLYWEGLTPEMLKPNVSTDLDYKMTRVSMQCEDQVMPSFQVIDNRAGTASENAAQYLGLGNVNGTGKVGYYTAQATSPTVDGGKAAMFIEGEGGAGPMVMLKDRSVVRWGKMATHDAMSGKDFAFDLVIQPTLASEKVMGGAPGQGETLMDGSMTLEFKFGV